MLEISLRRRPRVNPREARAVGFTAAAAAREDATPGAGARYEERGHEDNENATPRRSFTWCDTIASGKVGLLRKCEAVVNGVASGS